MDQRYGRTLAADVMAEVISVQSEIPNQLSYGFPAYKDLSFI